MEDVPRVARIGTDSVVYESQRSRGLLVPVGDKAPEGTDVLVALPDGRRLAYLPTPPSPDMPTDVVADPLIRGNAFVPVHESAHSLAAVLSVAAGRRVNTGPESERVLVVLRGTGLVFLEKEDTIPFETGDVVVIPGGESARLWSRGPEDLLTIALQPKGEPEKRRTLASEIAKRKEQPPE